MNNPPEFMATKNHKNPSADEALTAPMGAGVIFDKTPSLFVPLRG
jgi:hypothetical protein